MSGFWIEDVRKACEACLSDITLTRMKMLKEAEECTFPPSAVMQTTMGKNALVHREEDERRVKLILAYIDDLSRHSGPLKVLKTVQLGVSEYEPLRGYFGR